MIAHQFGGGERAVISGEITLGGFVPSEVSYPARSLTPCAYAGRSPHPAHPSPIAGDTEKRKMKRR